MKKSYVILALGLVLLLAATSMAKDPGYDRNMNPGFERTPFDCSGAIPIDCGSIVTGNTAGGTDQVDEYSCNSWDESGPEIIYALTTTSNNTIEAALSDISGGDIDVIILSACDNETCLAEGDNSAQTSVVPAGTYYVIVDGYYGDEASYTLTVNCVADVTCDLLPDGLFDNGDGTFTYRQTTDATDTPPLYEGPFNLPSECSSPSAGFDIYSWYNQDYGWKQYWPGWSTPNQIIQSVQVVICAWDVDYLSCVPGDCELDNIYVDGVQQTPTFLTGFNQQYAQTVFDVGAAHVLDDGYLDMWIDIDATHTGCIWATTLSWSQLSVTYSAGENSPPYTPEGYAYPLCVQDNSEMCVTVTGPFPQDPDNDAVTYTYRWFVANAETGWGYVDDELNPHHPIDHPGSCVPPSDSDVGDLWRVLVFAVDEHNAQSPQPWIVDFPAIIVDCQSPWPYTSIDMGDLVECNYPTLTSNPGHGLSNIAWLGATVDGEITPNSLNLDLGDDGVTYLDRPWMPCTPVQVEVVVTTGGSYADYAGSGGLLYLNGWKDGNLDGDFCDILCDNAPEWIVRDEVVTPGSHAFTFPDPGVFDMNTYDGVFRWRLSSRAMGPYGFGQIDAQACPSMTCGLVGLDFLGEVEDYVVEDMQLSVELLSFEAVASDGQVTLRWTTASETNNDRFDVLRDGTTIAQVPSLGNGASGHSYSWTDHGLVNGTAYTYSLVAVDVDGHRDVLATESVTPQAAQITEYTLTANYPNPFNPTTSFGYSLKEAGLVNLKVFDLAGRMVRELVNAEQPTGRYTVSFDGTGLPSGIYYYRLTVNGFSATQKMVLMK